VNLSVWLPLLILLSSLLPGLAIFVLREESHALRTGLNLFGAVAKLGLVAWMIWGVFHEQLYEARWTLAPGLDLAGNLFTFVIFYELLTLAPFPLIAHKGSPEALRGARIYLAYTLAGGMLLLVGAVWLRTIAGPLDFAEGGILGQVPGLDPATLGWIFLLLMAGLGVKAALVPLHGWLPQAMVVPAPVSALLHAVAVVKAGAFGIVRVVYDVYGVEFAASLGLLAPLGIVAALPSSTARSRPCPRIS